MSRAFTPKVVTANALLEGDVVYLRADDCWTRNLAEAEVMDTQDQAAARLLDAEMRADEVVGVYLADVSAGKSGPTAVHFRETFRASGPSAYARGLSVELNHV